MLSLSPAHRIWLCKEATDMRRSFDGSPPVVRNHLGSSGQWFAFINRPRTQIKVLAFQAGDYCVWSKRLDQGQFAALGRARGEKRTLSRMELLAGLLINKFCYHLPLYRRHQRLGQCGIQVSGSSLSTWVSRAIDLITPVVDAQRRHV